MVKQKVKIGKIKFHGLIFYDKNNKQSKVHRPTKEVKNNIEKYLNERSKRS